MKTCSPCRLKAALPVITLFVPQLQVSLSSRQHILASFGGRFPLNDRGGDRQPQFVFYLIWDWYDAGLFQAW